MKAVYRMSVRRGVGIFMSLGLAAVVAGCGGSESPKPAPTGAEPPPVITA